MANDVHLFPVPLVYKKILKDQMSGELLITHADFKKVLFFVDGRLAFATTTLEREQLGQILLAEGKIDRSQLEMALEVRQNVPARIGEIVAKMCDLSRGDIYEALKSQLKRIAVSTFSLTEGEWRFVMKNPQIPNPQHLNIKLADVIHEGVKNIDNLAYFKERFYYRSPVTTELPESIAAILTPREIEFHEELGRFFNTSIKQVLSWWKVPEAVFWRNIILLYLLNVADFIEFTVDDEEQNRTIEEINELHQKINAGELDYYGLLGTQKETSLQEIDDRFSDYSQKYDPEKLEAAPDSTAMIRARDVFSEIQKAYDAVRQEVEGGKDNTDAPKPGADARSEKAEPPPPPPPPPPQPEVSQVNQRKNPRELYTKANHLYNQKKYFEAASLLQEAVAIDQSRANYFLLLGLCQSKLTTTKKMAESNLRKAAEMEPWNADPVFALGQLYRSEKLMKKAKECFERALEINMEHTLAGQAMGELDDLFGKGGKKSVFSLFGKKK